MPLHIVSTSFSFLQLPSTMHLPLGVPVLACALLPVGLQSVRTYGSSMLFH